MALNPNHTFEDLENVKCSVAEKNCTAQRAGFLKQLLELNGFKVMVVKSPPAKAAAEVPATETFTVGVTDVSFNPVSAIYNRELKTSTGEIVTSGFWKQAPFPSKEDSWYWKK
jgi:hypothetical protein